MRLDQFFRGHGAPINNAIEELCKTKRAHPADGSKYDIDRITAQHGERYLRLRRHLAGKHIARVINELRQLLARDQ